MPRLQVISVAHVAFDRVTLLAAIGSDKDEGYVLVSCRLSGRVWIDVKEVRRNDGAFRLRTVCNRVHRLGNFSKFAVISEQEHDVPRRDKGS